MQPASPTSIRHWYMQIVDLKLNFLNSTPHKPLHDPSFSYKFHAWPFDSTIGHVFSTLDNENLSQPFNPSRDKLGAPSALTPSLNSLPFNPSGDKFGAPSALARIDFLYHPIYIYIYNNPLLREQTARLGSQIRPVCPPNPPKFRYAATQTSKQLVWVTKYDHFALQIPPKVQNLEPLRPFETPISSVNRMP